MAKDAKKNASKAKEAEQKAAQKSAPAPAKPAAVPADDSDEEDGYVPAVQTQEQDHIPPDPQGPKIEDNDEDYEEEEKAFVVPKGLEKDDSDDTLMLIAGGGGMFLCMALAAIAPRFGVPAENIMAGGMLTLLVFIVYAMFFPACNRKGKKGATEDITPVAVFVITGCIGTMLGGMFGGVLANIKY